MRPILPILLLNLISYFSFAGRISGTVIDEKGEPLSFSSIFVKGTTHGTTANSDGKYFLNLEAGTYTIVCQHVGYAREEKTISVGEETTVVDFKLHVQELTLGEVIVKKGEDPAYEIIRQAIKKRPYYNSQVDSFMVDVYIKGLLRSRGIPQKFMGQKIERDDFEKQGLDSAGKGILFLSESMTKVSFKKPDKVKYEVISSRQSGGGFGLSFPFFINFYDNNVTVFGNSLNQRGFISPISNSALSFYRYKFEGSFFEDGKEINRIKVIPRRKNEPLFSGHIEITENDWRIHSLELLTTNEYQLELIDTLRINQIHVPVSNDIWETKDQVVYVAVKKLGFDFAGNFVNVYTNYNINPGFRKKFFDRVFMKYDSAFNRKDTGYWNSIRPIPLEKDEKRNFVFKDSIAKAERDSFLTRRNIDSLRKNQKPMTAKGMLWGGDRHTFYSKKVFSTYSIKGLIRQLEYNTVEGLSINLEQSLNIRPIKGRYSYNLDWYNRYGVSNEHFYSWANLSISPRRNNFLQDRYLMISGGKKISQFNHDNPISPLLNELYTLLAKKNYMKLYENWFGGLQYNNRFENGIRWNLHMTYEDRIPVENTTDYSFFNKEDELLPNHPYELDSVPFNKHQAFVAGITLTYQPGQHYIQFPRYKMPVGSKYPTLQLEFNKGFNGLFGSDVDFDKWKFSVFDNMNFKIGGELRYRLSIGGFINAKKVEIPDLQHFNGNQTFLNFNYLNSFQLAPYYKYSNDEDFYALGHVEHHFNGLLTNKIPGFNKLKWNLVAGSNAFYVNNNNYYVEAFAGIENIFKLFRIDFVTAWQPDLGNDFGVRVGFGGLLGRAISRDDNNSSVSLEF
jgi:hypothetical protein